MADFFASGSINRQRGSDFFLILSFWFSNRISQSVMSRSIGPIRRSNLRGMCPVFSGFLKVSFDTRAPPAQSCVMLETFLIPFWLKRFIYNILSPPPLLKLKKPSSLVSHEHQSAVGTTRQAAATAAPLLFTAPNPADWLRSVQQSFAEKKSPEKQLHMCLMYRDFFYLTSTLQTST